MKIKLIPLILTLVAFCGLAMAMFNLDVFVTYKGQPVAGALVQVFTIGSGYTNQHGWIWFYNIPDGEYRVRASASIGGFGYEDDTTMYFSGGNQYLTMELHLPLP